MRIIIDAQGGDNAPREIVKGAIQAAEAYGVDASEISLGTDIREDLSNESMKMIVMISNLFMTYKTFSISPLSDRTKGILTACQFVNIGLVFIGCLAFPAKTGDGETLLINHLHDIVTISAWVLYGIGLIVFSFLLHKKDRFLGLLGMGLMFFTVFSSVFFVRRVIHPDSYVGASAISEVHIINSLFIFLTVMYVAEDYARREASTAHTP